MHANAAVALLVLLSCAPLARAAKEEPPEVRYAAMLEAEYGPLGRTTEQILGREKTHEPATVIGALLYRIRAKPPERLSLVEKKLIAVDDLRAEVNNGGFEQYFVNAAGNQAAVALQAFKDMGATHFSRLLQRAMGVFPGGKPPADLDKRQKTLAAIKRRALAVWGPCDDEFYLRDEAYSQIALAYAKKYRAQIVLP
jgi:hypothetical protein